MTQKPIKSRPSTGNNNSFSQTSRLSMTSSLLTTSKYPKCDYKKQHSKQILNLICLNQGCKSRGPICAMCKSSDHSTHLVIPIKKFLQNIQECLNKSSHKNESIMVENASTLTQKPKQIDQKQKKTEQESMLINQKQEQVGVQKQKKPQKTIQQIGLIKQRMLYQLSLQVNIIAQSIRKIEQKIISQANNAIQQTQNSINLSQNLHKIMNELQQEESIDSKIFELRIETLLGFIKYKTKDSFQINTNGVTKISHKINKMSQSFIANLEQWSTNSVKALSSIFQYNPNHRLNTQNKQKQSKESITDLKFLPEFKMKSINLLNDNKGAKLNQAKPGFALASGLVLKQKTIKIKITSLSSAIMVGVGFKDVIKKNEFKFASNGIGHGGYLLANNSCLYSHHSKSNNMIMKGITFATGQQLTISVKGQTVTFMKKSDPKSVMIALKKMSEQEWKQLVFCVVLNGVGDRVDIIQ